MTVVELDASRWINALDFYDALLGALGAPEWHGRNLDALADSIIYGAINAVEPPLKVEVRQLDAAGHEARSMLVEAFDALAEEGASVSIDPVSATLTVLRHA